MNQVPREDILGYAVFRQSLSVLVAEVVQSLEPNPQAPYPQTWFACMNPHSYVVALDQPQFGQALRSSTWLVPDGVGIVLASKILKGSIRARITGHDVFTAVSKAVNTRGAFSTLFIGSTEPTLALISDRYRSEFPNAREIHTFSPPFRSEFSAPDIAAIVDIVNRHRPDLLWLGLTAPKQELLLHHLKQSAQFGFGGAIGAVFDFYAGNVRRSPEVFHRLGLEWLPRLVQQPHRLWRRMLISAPIFVRDVLRAAIARKTRAPPP